MKIANFENKIGGIFSPPLLNEKTLIESLEHYGTPENYSDENRRKYCRCCVICRSSLNLINRQKAEIEICRATLKLISEELPEVKVLYHRDIQRVKFQAITKFAERLCKGRVSNDPVVIAVKVELKEMEGENEYV